MLFPSLETLTSVESAIADISAFTASYEPDRLPVARALYDILAAPEDSFPLSSLAIHASLLEMSLSNEDLLAQYDDIRVELLAGGGPQQASTSTVRIQ